MAPSLAYDAWAEEQERLAADEEWMQRPLSDAVRTEMRSVAEALKAWRPELEEFFPEKPLPWIELNDETLMVQFSIAEDSVSATMPYYGEDANPMMECLTSSIAVLAATGYIAYDPQLGRAVTVADKEEMAALYAGVPSPAVTALSIGQGKKPWWKFW